MDHHRHFGYIRKFWKKHKALVIEQLTHCVALVSACFEHCVLSCCKPSKAQAVCDCRCRLSVLLFHRCFACCLLQFLCLVGWFCFCFGFLVGEMSLSGIMQQQQQPILLCMLVVVLSLLLLCAHTESAMDWSSSSTSTVTELLSSSGSSSSKEQYDEIESSSVMRRMLANSPFFISYGSLSADRIPCPAGSGRSYYTNNCAAATGPARPYTRGCSAITLCARGWIVNVPSSCVVAFFYFCWRSFWWTTFRRWAKEMILCRPRDVGIIVLNAVLLGVL